MFEAVFTSKSGPHYRDSRGLGESHPPLIPAQALDPASLRSASARPPPQADQPGAAPKSAWCPLGACAGWESLLPRVWPGPVTPLPAALDLGGVGEAGGGIQGLEPDLWAWIPALRRGDLALLCLRFVGCKHGRGSSVLVSGCPGDLTQVLDLILKSQVQRLGTALVKVIVAAYTLKS